MAKEHKGKYYYLKLKENFFESEDMKILQAMKEGYLFSDILLKLYLKSLKQDGRLMYRGAIPYTSEMIAALTNHDVSTVEKAMKTFVTMNFIEVLDNGAIYMTDIQNYIGKSTDEADRIRAYRASKNDEKKLLSNRDSRPKISNESVTNEQDLEYISSTSDVQNPYICTDGEVQKSYKSRTNVQHLNSENVADSTGVQMYDKCTTEIRDKRLENRDKRIEIRDINNNNLNLNNKNNISVVGAEQSPKSSALALEFANVEALILNDGSEWRPTVGEFEEYVRLYPNVDVEQEFRNMRGWLLSNPSRRKTRTGIKSFVTRWLSKEQNNGTPRNTTADSKNPFMQYAGGTV